MQRFHNAGTDSTVFTTSNRQLAIFGNTIGQIKAKWTDFIAAYDSSGHHLFGTNGAIPSLFSRNAPGPEVFTQFEEFKTRFNGSNLSAQALAEEMGNVDSRIVDYAKTCRNGELTTRGFEQAMGNMSLSAKAGKAALQAFAAAGNMLAGFLVMAGFQAAFTAIDNYIHRVEKANEAMDDAVSEYGSAKSGLENISSELDGQRQQMDALLAKGSLTYIEKGQLEDLKEATKELQTQKAIAQQQTERASKEAADKTVAAYKKQYGNYELSKASINGSMSYDNYLASESAHEDNIASNITALFKHKELLEQAQKDFNAAVSNKEDTTPIESDIQFHIDEIDAFSRFLDSNISDLEEKRLALEEEYNKAIEKRDHSASPLTTSETEIIGTYERIANSIKLIYEYTDPDKWNAMQTDKIFDTEGIEKTKHELLKMAASDELTPAKIAVRFPNLYNAIHENQMTAQEFCDEIYNCADAAERLKLSFSEAWDSLADTEDASLQNDLLSLAKAGQLTMESFNNTKGSDTFLAKLGLEPGDTEEIQEVIGKINQLVSSSEQLASMKKGISGLTENLQAKQENPGKAIGPDVLAGMDESLKAQTSEWEHYQAVMGNASSSMEEAQEATNRLASAFLNNNNYLANLTESEKAYYISQLEAMGVANAEEIVQQSLVDKHELNRLKTEALNIATGNVTDATIAEVNSFLQEQGASYGVANAILAAVEAKRIFANESLGLTTQISQLETFTNKTYGAAAAIRFAELTGGYDDKGYKITNGMTLKEAMEVVQAEFMPLKNMTLDFSSGGSGRYSGGNTPSQTPSDPPKTETPEDFNFIETAITRIKAKIDEVKNAAKEAFASFKRRRSYYASAISEIGKEIDIQKQADSKYTERANNVGLDEKYAAQIRDGSMNIETVSDEDTKKRIREYKEWYEKALACREAVKALRKEQKELARENIELLISKYEKLFSRLDAQNSRIKNFINAKETWGFSADIKDYKSMNTNIRSQIGNISKQNKELARLKGTVSKTSEAWYEYDKRMKSNNETAQDLKKTMAENAKAAAELSKAKADKKIEKYDSKDALINAKLDNAIKPRSKNGLINNKIKNIKHRQDAYNDAVRTDKHNVWVAKNRLVKTANPKKGKTKAEENIRKNIQALANAGKPITQKLLKAAYNLKDKGKLYNACLLYNAYLEARDSDKAAADLYAQTSKQDKADLAMERFNNTAAGYDHSLAENEQKKTELNSKIALDEKLGRKANLAYYDGLLSAENGTQKKLIAKRNALQNSLDQAVSRKLIKVGSDEWYEMVEAINSVTNEIDESVNSAAELKNTIRQIKWDTFDASLETIKRINSEADFLINLMGKNKDLINKDSGEFTDYGKASLTLYKQQYESYLAQADEYAKEYNNIMKQVGNGELSLGDDAVVQRLRELQDLQRDSKLSAEDILSSIIDLIRNGYEAQLDALDKLIQKYKDLRQNEKDAYEYQKNIAEKTKKIAALQKQLHAYEGNDTEEARAKIQKLKVDLEDARQDLAEAEYDKYLSDMNDMLDGLYNDFESFIDKKLNDTDAILAMINDSLCGKSDSIIAILASLNGEPSSDLQALLKGDISSSEYMSRVIENDKKQPVATTTFTETPGKPFAPSKSLLLTPDYKSIAQDYIKKHADKAKKKRSEYSDINKVIYDNKANLYKGKGRILSSKELKALAKKLNVNYNGDNSKKGALYKKLKKLGIKGFASGSRKIQNEQIAITQEQGTEFIYDSSRREMIIPLSRGDKVFNSAMSQRLWDIAQKPPEEVRTLLQIDPQPIYAASAATPDLQRDLDFGNVNVAINELSLPGVTNYEDFKAALIRDNKFEKAVQAMTIDRAVGGHPMAKLKHI